MLTWNVLAPSPTERLAGLFVEPASLGRARALLHEAHLLDPDALALQEVGAELMQGIAADADWAGYHASVEGPEAPPGGLLVLSRFRFSKVAYRKLPSPTGRHVLFATLDLGDQELVVADVHLESVLEDRVARIAQLDFVAARLPGSRPVVWLGDFNFGDDDPEARHLIGWTDAWVGLRPGEPGYTYDLAANPLARDNALASEPSRRLDRILVSRRLSPVAVGRVGTADPPSDHFGVWADLLLHPSPP